jgi:hypothetical protein
MHKPPGNLRGTPRESARACPALRNRCSPLAGRARPRMPVIPGLSLPVISARNNRPLFSCDPPPVGASVEMTSATARLIRLPAAYRKDPRHCTLVRSQRRVAGRLTCGFASGRGAPSRRPSDQTHFRTAQSRRPPTLRGGGFNVESLITAETFCRHSDNKFRLEKMFHANTSASGRPPQGSRLADPGPTSTRWPRRSGAAG